MNFQMFKLVLEKAEEPEIKLQTSPGSGKTKRVTEKYIFLFYFDSMDHNKLEYSSRDGNIRPPDLSLEKSGCNSESHS